MGMGTDPSDRLPVAVTVAVVIGEVAEVAVAVPTGRDCDCDCEVRSDGREERTDVGTE